MKAEIFLNKVRGCLIGGTAGDALGFPVEFFTADHQRRQEDFVTENGKEER